MRYNNTNDIEKLLQQEANNYSMSPSDKVWENIREEMQGKQKWTLLPIVFTAIIIALTITTALNYPPQKFLIKHFDSPLSATNNTLINTTRKSNSESKNIWRKQNPSIFKFLGVHNASFTTTLNVENDNISNKIDLTIADKNLSTANIVYNNTLSIVSSNNTIKTGVKEFNNNLDNNFDENVASILANDNKSTEILKSSTKKILVKNDVINYLNTFSNTILKKEPKKSKWQIQYYATISNSYRTLEDDKSRASFMGNSSEKQALKSNVNNIVKHIPAVGGEFGISFLYKLTKNLHIKSGVQLNVTQYKIDAYRANGNAIFSYVKNNKLNSMSLRAAYTTEVGNGSAATKLDNQMYQLSVPIGLQWDVINGKRWGLSAAATIQPTVTLNKDVYVVSTDYKYYTDGTSFFRRFNVNTSTELLLTLKSKNAKWFFGPQIRQQQLPTYNDIYPIKEYRVDYGIKFGVVKSF